MRQDVTQQAREHAKCKEGEKIGARERKREKYKERVRTGAAAGVGVRGCGRAREQASTRQHEIERD